MLPLLSQLAQESSKVRSLSAELAKLREEHVTNQEAAAKLASQQTALAKYKSTVKAQEQVIAKLEEMLAKNISAKGARVCGVR